MKILVVDDSSTMRRIITNTLNRAGYLEILTAENGVDALAQMRKNPVEFILTDWNMPVMDGLEFVNKVREFNQEIPILMITTNASKDDIVQALQAGVTNYIVKPFTPDTLNEKINSILS